MVPLVPAYTPAGNYQKHRPYSGNRQYSLTLLVVTICATRLQRHYSGQLALLNQIYRGRPLLYLSTSCRSFGRLSAKTMYMTNNNSAGLCQLETPTLQQQPALTRTLTLLYWLFPYASNVLTGTITGNRLYSTGSIEVPLPYRYHYRWSTSAIAVNNTKITHIAKPYSVRHSKGIE